MAYGKNNQELLLKEGVFYVGTWSSPHLITPAVDPELSFDGPEDLGWFQQGTLDPQINREYAEFLGGTPGQLVRKDLIRKSFFIMAQFAQYNADLMELVMGLLVELGVFDIAWIGPDEPTQSEQGYMIKTALVNGDPFMINLWSGRQTGEAIGPKLPGTAHSTYDQKAEAFPHSDFLGTANADQRSYGMFVFTN